MEACFEEMIISFFQVCAYQLFRIQYFNCLKRYIRDILKMFPEIIAFQDLKKKLILLLVPEEVATNVSTGDVLVKKKSEGKIHPIRYEKNKMNCTGCIIFHTRVRGLVLII